MAYKDQWFIPPKGVQAKASSGLKKRRKYKRGGLSNAQAKEAGVGSGVQRAVNLSNGNKVSPKTIKRMVSFFARHEKNKNNKTPNGEPSAGAIAWDLWGGDEGKRWAESVKSKMEKEDNKDKNKK